MHHRCMSEPECLLFHVDRGCLRLFVSIFENVTWLAVKKLQMMTLYDVIILNVILGVFCYVSNLETLCFMRWNTLFLSRKHFVPARETIFTRCLFTTIWRYAYILWRLMSCLNYLLFSYLHRIWRYDVYFIYFSRNQYFLFMIAV